MLSRDVEESLNQAIAEAHTQRHEFVTTEHLLNALLKRESTKKLLKDLNIVVATLEKGLTEHLNNLDVLPDDEATKSRLPQATVGLQRILQRAIIQVQSAGRQQVSVGNVLVAMFDEAESTALYLLQSQGLTRLQLISHLSHGNLTPVTGVESTGFQDGSSSQNQNKSALESFAVNLNQRAEDGKIDPLVGRADVLERVIQVLCRRTKNNPVLVGDPGVGKTAIAEGLALRIVEGKVPKAIENKTIFALDIGSLLAGTKFRGDFEERIKAVMKDIEDHPDAILFIDEIHTLVGAGGSTAGAMDASNLLKPALAKGALSCIGSTTHKEYRQVFEKDSALARRFQRVDIEEPTQEEAFEILKGLRSKYEEHHNVEYTDLALKSAVDLSTRYITGRFLPDKAIDVMDEAGARKKIAMTSTTTETKAKEKVLVGSAPHTRAEEESAKESKGLITEKEIEETIALMAKIPARSVNSNDKEKLRHLERDLKLLIYGQDPAISSLVASIKMARSGLGRKNKPMGSFLFAGPTGVGKTEVAKQLAQQLGVPFLRFDMSEYMEKHAVSRLVGAPPGYVGYDEGGLLTESVNKNPYCVLLLDEIEKAHPDLMNILLQVMDNASLTDSNGRTASFQNVTLIMTSNAGARDVAKAELGIVPSQKDTRSLEAIKKSFAPEFLNRLDAIVQFSGLNKDILLQVINKFVIELEEQLREKNVTLKVTDKAREWILNQNYDPTYGARPMARAIDQMIKKPLVDELLFGKLENGGKVVVDEKDGKLVFNTSST